MRFFLPALATSLIAIGSALAADPAAQGSTAALSAPALPGAIPAPADSQRIAAHREARADAYREHAPLALFSLGSLAVGGVFYAIGQGMDRPSVSVSAADRSRIGTAVAVAGLSALLAAGSYFYYAHKSGQEDEEGSEPVSDWQAALIGGPDGAGGMAVGARLTLPLPSIR